MPDWLVNVKVTGPESVSAGEAERVAWLLPGSVASSSFAGAGPMIGSEFTKGVEVEAASEEEANALARHMVEDAIDQEELAGWAISSVTVA